MNTPRNRFWSNSLVAALSCLIFCSGLAGESPVRIVAPKTGSLYHPGDAIEVNVEAEKEMKGVFLASRDPIGYRKFSGGNGSFKLKLELPKDMEPGPYVLIAEGYIVFGSGTGATDVVIDVERADSPVRLVPNDPQMLVHIGRPSHVYLAGVFADGTKCLLDDSSLNRSQSDNPAVATSKGLSVTGVAPGSAMITITNGTAEVTVRAEVVR